MPELPEVESIKNSLSSKIINKTIDEINILSQKNFIGDKNKVIGTKITSLERYGKVLIFKLSNNYFLNIHFKLSGQMLYADNIDSAFYKNIIPFTKTNKMPGKTTRVIIKFTDNSGLFFNDLRKFGWIKVSKKPLIPKGVDVLSKNFTLNYFEKIILASKKPIKILLMDQDKITGIGNIYANDSLFKAKIHPLKKSNELTKKEINNLYQSIKEEINQGIKDKGSSGADEAFILPDGSKGSHQRHFLVYQRENKPCPRCKTLIKRIKQNGRSSFFCPKCQKLVENG